MPKNSTFATQTTVIETNEGEYYAPATETVLFHLNHLRLSARWLYLQMCFLAGSGIRCYEELEELAECMQITTRHTSDLLQELEQEGLIELCVEEERRRGGRVKTTNYYHINKFPIKSRFSRAPLRVVATTTTDNDAVTSRNSTSRASTSNPVHNMAKKISTTNRDKTMVAAQPDAEPTDSEEKFEVLENNFQAESQEADNNHVPLETTLHELMNHESSVCVQPNFGLDNKKPENSNQGSVYQQQPKTILTQPLQQQQYSIPSQPLTNTIPTNNKTATSLGQSNPAVTFSTVMSSSDLATEQVTILSLLEQVGIVYDKAEYLAGITALSVDDVQTVIEIATDPARSYHINSVRGLIAHAVENSYIPDIRRRGETVSGANPTANQQVEITSDTVLRETPQTNNNQKPVRKRGGYSNTARYTSAQKQQSYSDGPIDLTKYQPGGKYYSLTQQNTVCSDEGEPSAAIDMPKAEDDYNSDSASGVATAAPPVPINYWTKHLIKQIDPQACDWLRIARIEANNTLCVAFSSIGKERYTASYLDASWLPQLHYHGITQIVLVGDD